MDVFKFNNDPSSPLLMSSGEIVNGLKTKMWIERYREAGEFTFTADATAAMRSMLPVGSFVSHVDTSEIMIVENHEITSQKGEKPLLTITGRGLETVLEQRVVHGDFVYPNSTPPSPDPFPVPITYAEKAVSIIWEYTRTDYELWQPAMKFSYIHPSTVVTLPPEVDPWVQTGISYTRLMEILELGGLGVKVVRPGNWSVQNYPAGDAVVYNDAVTTEFVIHRGADKSARMVFSNDTGEIENAEYLWSNKKVKNAALVQGPKISSFSNPNAGYWAAVIPEGVNEYDLRILLVDATGLTVSDAPDAGELATLYATMEQLGRDALMFKKEVALTKAEVSKNADLAVYRKDFDVGDIITVAGAYGESVPMRISEFVEIEDENGETGQPVLEIVQ